jgi:hypothetical protein
VEGAHVTTAERTLDPADVYRELDRNPGIREQPLSKWYSADFLLG